MEPARVSGTFALRAALRGSTGNFPRRAERGIIRCVISLVEQHREEIAALCRRYGVRKLELFGSAASGSFDASTSDIDFFYEFDADPTSLSDRFFGLMEDLERLLGRKVDLVSSRDARNPYFLEVANRHRTTFEQENGPGLITCRPKAGKFAPRIASREAVKL
jgi:predicted nucleotidyltransferase